MRKQQTNPKRHFEQLREYIDSIYGTRYSKLFQTHCGQADPRPMSDDLEYDNNVSTKCECARKRQEREILVEHKNKSDFIKKCKESIVKLLAKIEKIKTDQSITPNEKQRKISRCQEIITNYKQSIISALRYLKQEKSHIRNLYTKNARSK